MHVLYVEDSITLRDSITRGLRREGYAVTAIGDGEEGLDAALVNEYDVIVLDVMLPGKSGFEILRELRNAGIGAEVMMLTARAGIEDRVEGLDLGADDYLVKPFAFEEFVARIRALIRRRYEAKKSVLKLGPFRLDFAARRLFKGEEEMTIRPREFDLLTYLLLHEGRIVSRTELIDSLYDHAAEVRSNAVDSAVCNLRKILAEGGCGDYIRTVPRRGYLLEKTSEEDRI